MTKDKLIAGLRDDVLQQKTVVASLENQCKRLELERDEIARQRNSLQETLQFIRNERDMLCNQVESLMRNERTIAELVRMLGDKSIPF